MQTMVHHAAVRQDDAPHGRRIPHSALCQTQDERVCIRVVIAPNGGP